jgi:hypothetical protein
MDTMERDMKDLLAFSKGVKRSHNTLYLHIDIAFEHVSLLPLVYELYLLD